MTTKNKIQVFTEVSLQNHGAGFGMWERGILQVSPRDSFALVGDLIQSLYLEMDYISLADALADADFIRAGIVDIRGNIYNEPNIIVARISTDGGVDYAGIVASDVDEDFFD